MEGDSMASTDTKLNPSDDAPEPVNAAPLNPAGTPAEPASAPAPVRDSSYVLTLEEIAKLTAVDGKPAETLMNVVALIAKRFKVDVCSAYLLESDRSNLVLAATVGLKKKCIGTLRMGIHEGLAGLVAEQVRPV